MASSSRLDLIEFMPTPKRIKTASTSLPSSSSSASPPNLSMASSSRLDPYKDLPIQEIITTAATSLPPSSSSRSLINSKDSTSLPSSSSLDLFNYMPTPKIIKTASTSLPYSSSLDLFYYMPTPKIIKTASTSIPPSSSASPPNLSMASSSRLDLYKDLPIQEIITTASTSLPSSSSSASPPNLKWTYDVFLSFRGEDTRNNIVGHLFEKLKDKGINTFLDNERLEQGKEISPELLKAIKESRLAIIIFSENYASSSWCLDELVHIIDCTKETGQIVYPVFYNVDPSNVRKQEGSFAKPFDKHEKTNVASEKMEKWRKALSHAGSIAGWDTRGGHEAKIIQKIVEKIFDKLSHALLHVDDHLVGMKIRVEEINTGLNLGSNDVKFVGIHGLGGIGKTTTAKVIYNQISYQFEGCSYLANVRETYEKEGNLVSLQKQLIRDILKVEVDIGNDDRGSSIIQHRLNNKNVLIILDDVDHVNQLEKLAGNGKWFGPGSRIIITTRNQQLLNIYEGVQRYEVKECDRDKSLEIFSWKAFKRNYPPEDFMDLSNEVVYYAKGLPLALTVLGSHLCNRSKDEWEGAMDQLKIAPNEEITGILKISFEGLNQTQKDVFLDIACFFTGEDKDRVMEKLHSFGFVPRINIPVLIEKSLITVSAKNELMMHDLLQDMGRHIVRQESPKNPEERSRLWNIEDIRRVLENNMATKAIEGIQPEASMLDWSFDDEPVYDWSFKAEAFMEMKNLRFLEWEYYPCEHLVLHFPHHELVHLSLRSSSIKLLWNGRKVLPHLKSIDLTGSKHLREFPDVSGLPKLERLSLQRCDVLVKIHPSVWVHTGLKFLDLSECYDLKSFPNKIEMESLETLNLGLYDDTGTLDEVYGYMEEFPEVHGNMKRLSNLVLFSTAIKGLPSSIENFTALKILDLTWCVYLVCLPSSICKLKYLEELILSDCSALYKLPEDLGELESLVKLDASSTAIKEVPDSIQSLDKLRHLSFCGCNGLNLPSFNGLSSLTNLDLRYCSGLNLPSFNGLSSLTDLDLSFCSGLNLPSFNGLSSLTNLDLSFCSGLNLPSFNGLSSLTNLNLRSCSGLNLPSFNGLSSLTNLNLGSCRGLKLPSFNGLSSLTNLNLRGCSGLNLPSFNGLSSLTNLDLSYRSGLKLPSFNGLSSLTDLNLSSCSGLNLPSFNGLSSLTNLNLSYCSGLNLPSFNGLSSLTDLDLSSCDLTDETFPSNIECLLSLEKLDLSGNNFVSLPANISQLSLLTELRMHSCKRIKSIPELPSIRYLYAVGCTSLTSVPTPIKALKGYYH